MCGVGGVVRCVICCDVGSMVVVMLVVVLSMVVVLLVSCGRVRVALAALMMVCMLAVVVMVLCQVKYEICVSPNGAGLGRVWDRFEKTNVQKNIVSGRKKNTHT